jgi:hypothetical protein
VNVQEKSNCAKSVVFPGSTTGVYLTTKLFPQLGVAHEMAGKVTNTGVAAVGDAEIAVQPVSELPHAPGVDFAGTIPPESEASLWRDGRSSRMLMKDACSPVPSESTLRLMPATSSMTAFGWKVARATVPFSSATKERTGSWCGTVRKSGAIGGKL